MEDVQGLQELLSKLDRLPLTLGRTLIVRALRQGALPIQERAAQLAPDDPETPGSRIEFNMMTTITDQTATGAIAKIGPSTKGFVGIFAEFGTAHQTGTPFLGPAFDDMKEEALKIIGEELAESIERELKKAG